MRILDRYILKSIITMFLGTILLFTFLYMLIDAATHLDDFLANKVPYGIIINYYASFFPVIFVQTSPIACLLSVLFTYSGLNNNNEIIALRASGLNYQKITRPAIMFGLMVTALVFLVNERFAPQAATIAQDIKKGKIEISEKERTQRADKPQPIKYLFFYGLNNKLFFIDEYDPGTKTLNGVTVIGQDGQQRMTDKITAFKAIWTAQGWKFLNCQIARYNPEDQTLTDEIQFFKEKMIDLGESPDDLLKQKLNVTSMNIRQLKVYIKRFKASGAIAALNNLKVDLQQKIAYPFACIVIIFVGLPFALVTGKRKGLTFASVGIALAIGFLFYVVNAVGLALGKGGILPPIAAAWLAPMLFTAAGIYFIKKMF
ncbi:MAG: LptF/LptG family permease [Candidatus Omnitrophica bacterium]|nr:LptF/LptG family permease [Candidatus Omnitrophota bacterium]